MCSIETLSLSFSFRSFSDCFLKQFACASTLVPRPSRKEGLGGGGEKKIRMRKKEHVYRCTSRLADDASNLLIDEAYAVCGGRFMSDT